MATDYGELPPNLPIPEDDGAADHLTGMALPEVHLPSTLGGAVDLADLSRNRLVAYVYPRTGTPGQPSPTGCNLKAAVSVSSS
jgi:peroxiredoxin